MSAGSAFSVTPASMARRPQLRSVAGESGMSVWDRMGYVGCSIYGIWYMAVGQRCMWHG